MSETFFGPDFNQLQSQDPQIAEILLSELERQRKNLQLIASENFTSPAVLTALGSTLSNKYAEGYPGKRYYGGCEVVDRAEIIAIERAKQLFGAEHANVQPHSGASANIAVYTAFTKPGDTVLAMSLPHGGHLTHGSPVNYSGKLYKTCFYGVEKETGLINFDKVEKIAKKEMPKLIICGASAYSRDWDYVRLRKIADKVGALLLGDISHPSGLIAKGILNDPLPHCHIVTTTTHKTLRGPRGGLIMMGKDFPNPYGITTPKGEKVIDFGQNLVGWVKMKVKGEFGTKIVLSHAEVLDKYGNFYTDNLRAAKAQNTYVCSGVGEETFEPPTATLTSGSRIHELICKGPTTARSFSSSAAAIFMFASWRSSGWLLMPWRIAVSLYVASSRVKCSLSWVIGAPLRLMLGCCQPLLHCSA